MKLCPKLLLGVFPGKEVPNSKLITSTEWRVNLELCTFAHGSTVLRLVISAVGTCLETIPIRNNDMASRHPDDAPALQIV